MRTGSVPNRLDRCTRTLFPAIVVWTALRMVNPAYPLVTFGTAAACAVPHVAVHGTAAPTRTAVPGAAAGTAAAAGSAPAVSATAARSGAAKLLDVLMGTPGIGGLIPGARNGASTRTVVSTRTRLGISDPRCPPTGWRGTLARGYEPRRISR